MIISDAVSKTIGALKRRALRDKLGSLENQPEIDVPSEVRLSVAEAPLLVDRVLPGTEYLKRAPLPEDGLLASLINDGDPGSAAKAYAVKIMMREGLSRSE